jgi:ABC-type transport system substrate-binding protein
MIYGDWNRKTTTLVPLMLTLLFIIACGTSAPESQPASDATQAIDAAPAAQPTEAMVADEPTTAPPVVQAPAATAQAQPTPTPLPAEVIYQGKINVLVGGFGNERFIARYCTGECNAFGRLLHGYLATTTHQGGVIPEALERWEISDDGNAWILHMREGIKFHNGNKAYYRGLAFQPGPHDGL